MQKIGLITAKYDAFMQFIVPTLCVGMQPQMLQRLLTQSCTFHFATLERYRMNFHAERGRYSRLNYTEVFGAWCWTHPLGKSYATVLFIAVFFAFDFHATAFMAA